MTLHSSLLALVVDGALGAWLGTIVFFSFVGAPTVFDVLPEDDAGAVVNAIFPKYYVLGVALGAVALLAGAAGAATGTLGLARGVLLGATAVGVALFAYSRWVLIPKMDAAGDRAFERYHQRSVVLNGLTMVAVAGGLVAANV
jgi:hypothetical protein